ncbi:ABC transporter permease [Metabacillus fastidiosus]|uniref:ABC transporter permease n=1 Tax=Metabacillus fastidiosus TaxID=1458 RepID=A0ABU6NXX8_9BACI|nr:ABC transporter permease [Metabacillus fastidiosus]MED4401962.1 ABC transporter permease [Metabacillus fastidiosus]MED4460905.1 ABC transporter permease [Metabacillus fastidiosus]
MKTMRQFFKHTETYIGLAVAFAFLLIFFSVWMTAYDGVSERTDDLKIGFINEDEYFNTDEIVKQIPFQMKTYESVETAKKEMNERKLDMVMQIPENFTGNLQKGETNSINYFINEANPTMSKQIMDGAAKNITGKINENVYQYKQQIIQSNLSEQMKTTLPSEELAKNVSANISQVIQSLNIHPVQPSIEKVNEAKGFAVTMVPMMVVLASYVGSMIMSMNINIVAAKLKSNYSKWSIFMTRLIINLGASILLALITLLFLEIFNMNLKLSIFEFLLFQVLVFFSFLSLTQMFVIVFGQGGMLFNILLLSLQLVTSGVIVPRAMLSSFYQGLGEYLPATYAAEGYYNIIFGGTGMGNVLVILLLITAVTLFIAAGRVLFTGTTSKSSSSLAVDGEL